MEVAKTVSSRGGEKGLEETENKRGRDAIISGTPPPLSKQGQTPLIIGTVRAGVLGSLLRKQHIQGSRVDLLRVHDADIHHLVRLARVHGLYLVPWREV